MTLFQLSDVRAGSGPFFRPNHLSWARMFAFPVIWLAYVYVGPFSALGIYAVACITDYLDGRLARRWGMSTPFGKRLDELADKVFLSGTGIMLIYEGVLPLDNGFVQLITITIVVRDLFMGWMRARLPEVADRVPTLPLAKWKTVMLMVSLGLFLATGIGTLSLSTLVWGWFGAMLLLAASAVAAIVTMCQYVRRFLEVNRQIAAEELRQYMKEFYTFAEEA